MRRHLVATFATSANFFNADEAGKTDSTDNEDRQYRLQKLGNGQTNSFHGKAPAVGHQDV